MTLPILCLDFDGVIHSYRTPWRDGHIIPDPPTPGAMQFIEQATERFRVAIFSSRSHMTGGKIAMKEWLVRYMAEYLKIMHEVDELAASNTAIAIVYDKLEWPDVKPSAFLTIDDRALTFTREWPTMESLKSFRPWNKR